MTCSMYIPLNGKHSHLSVRVDADDYPLLKNYRWYYRHGYAVTTFHIKGKSRADKDRNYNQSLHRLVMQAAEGDVVDHKNQCRLDCRKSNLRLVTAQQNAWNSSTSKEVSGAVGYIGVTKSADASSYTAKAGDTNLGQYLTAEDAAMARDKHVLALRGVEFAVLNFPLEDVLSADTPEKRTRWGVRSKATGGVNYASNRKAKKKWRCYFRKKHYGWFYTEEEAKEKLLEVLNASSIG